MARLSRDVVKQREEFVLKFFKENPTLAAVKGQEALKASGIAGGMMRPQRLYELQKTARGLPPPEVKSITEAAVVTEPVDEKTVPPNPVASEQRVVEVEAGGVAEVVNIFTGEKM